MPARIYTAADVSVSPPASYAIVDANDDSTTYRIGNGRTYRARHVGFDGTLTQAKHRAADLSNQLSSTLAAMSVDEAGRHRAHVMRTAVAFIAAWDGRLRIVRAADKCNACEKAGKPCVVAAIVLQGGGSRAVSSCVRCHSQHGVSCDIQLGLALGKRPRGTVRESAWQELGSTLQDLRSELSSTDRMTAHDKKRWKGYVGRALFIVDGFQVKTEHRSPKRPVDYSKYRGRGGYAQESDPSDDEATDQEDAEADDDA